MTFLWLPVVALLGAFGRRAAGGALNQWFRPNGPRVMGDTPARLIFAACVALAALLGGAVPWLALAMVPAAFVGTTTGNFESLSMGRGSYTVLHDWLGMSAHAALSAIAPALLILGAGLAWGVPGAWWPVAAFTMLAAPLYQVGWMVAGHGKWTWPVGLQGGTEVAEALWGASCAVGAFLSFAVASHG